MPIIALGQTRAAGGFANISGPSANQLSVTFGLPPGCRDIDRYRDTLVMVDIGVAAYIPSLSHLAIARFLDALERGEDDPDGHAHAGGLYVGVVSPISCRPCDVGPAAASFILSWWTEHPAFTTVGDGYENSYTLYANGVEALRALGALMGAIGGQRPRLVYSRQDRAA